MPGPAQFIQCQSRVVTEVSLAVLSKKYNQLTTYNVCTLKAEQRQQELVGILQRRKLMCIQSTNTGIVSSSSSYTRVSHFLVVWDRSSAQGRDGDASVHGNYWGTALMSLAAMLNNRIFFNHIQTHQRPTAAQSKWLLWGQINHPADHSSTVNH